MDSAAMTRRVGPTRLVLVLAAIVGILGMHALVVGTPTAAHATHDGHAVSAIHASHDGGVTGSGPQAAAAQAAAPSDAAGSAGHDPADHSGLAHLCLALAAAIFLLLVRRFLVPAVLAGPPGPVVRVRAAAARWIRPPPDLVGVLCVSRT